MVRRYEAGRTSRGRGTTKRDQSFRPKESVGVNSETILDELLGLLEGTGVEVRTEPMGGGGGGTCNIKGKTVVFLDSQGSTMERAAICARALAKVADIEAIYMKPEVRQFVEREAERTM